MNLKPQHQRAMDKLRERFIDDPRYMALIVGGSVAKGTAREDSDLDCSLVVANEEWERRRAARDYWFYLKEEICDYPGGYAELRVYSLDFLKEVAERGTEVLRSQFFNAIVVFSHRPEIEEIVRLIPIYPEAEREEKMAVFYSLATIWVAYIRDAERENDSYYLALASGNLVHYASRLILAYNRMLYTSSKYLMKRVREAPQKPENFLELAEKATRQPGLETAKALIECLQQYRDWGVDLCTMINLHIENIEWGWRNGRLQIPEW